MTKFSKILTIFVTMSSLAFVGFAIAAYFAGPDWSEAMAADYFKKYEITKSEGAEPTWNAIRASDDGQVASSKVLPEVLTKVMDEVQQQRQQEIQDLQTREPLLTSRIEALDKQQAVDEAALQQYVEQMRTRLAQLTQQESDLTSKVTAMAVEARKVERQIVSRREDVFRLNQQVEELKADMFRLNEIRDQLRDLDFQLQEHLARASERNKSLTKDYNPSPVQE